MMLDVAYPGLHTQLSEIVSISTQLEKAWTVMRSQWLFWTCFVMCLILPHLHSAGLFDRLAQLAGTLPGEEALGVPKKKRGFGVHVVLRTLFKSGWLTHETLRFIERRWVLYWHNPAYIIHGSLSYCRILPTDLMGLDDIRGSSKYDLDPLY